MVKTKQQKSKPKRNPQVKKQGKQADDSQFRAQLDALDLKIIKVTADGNCFFRALADQLEGDEEEHKKYRKMVVQYIMKNREMFEPFIEDDIPFDEYCQSMEKDGTWAGHMELQAASLVTRSNICIHQNMSPRWYIRNFDQVGARMVHLSYHDEEHYNSVRSKEDPCDGPPKPIRIKADGNISEATHQAKAANNKSKGRTAKDIIDTGSIKLLMAGSGCENAEKAKEVLLQVDGDVDSAIEFLIADKENECSVSLHSHTDTSDDCEKVSGDRVGDNNVQHNKEDPVELTNKNNSSRRSHDNSSTQKEDKKIPRNKVCPCGSKKKYKACCGAVKGRSATDIIHNPVVASAKGKKQRKQGKRGSADSASSYSSDSIIPDVGALCI